MARKKVPQSARLSAGGGVQSLFGQCPNVEYMIVNGSSLSSPLDDLCIDIWMTERQECTKTYPVNGLPHFSTIFDSQLPKVFKMSGIKISKYSFETW